MKVPFTSLNASYRQTVRETVGQKKVRRRLSGLNADYLKIVNIVKLMTAAFTDNQCMRIAWNSLPSLFYYSSKLDKLIDSKYLAAIRKLNFLQKESEQMSECELYYTWLFFQGQMGQFNTSLISLTSFYEFQESWRALNIPYNNLICTDYHTPGESSADIEELKVEDPNQLNIHFY